MWFQECCSTHSGCANPLSRTQGWRPARLLQIEPGGTGILRLCTRAEADASYFTLPYMTLSYRWGHHSNFLLQETTLETFKRGFPISTLPRTFQDAVEIARHLSIQFIWIDALCIIQDSQSDWHAEALTMRDVYAHTTCNIAASAAKDEHDGFFKERDIEEILPARIEAHETDTADHAGRHFYTVFAKEYWKHQLDSSSLHSRGWVFQECLLAPRILYFGRHQVLWQCHAVTKCEAFPACIPYNIADMNLDHVRAEYEVRRSAKNEVSASQRLRPTPIYALWDRLVERYSACGLTRSTDKLPAFAGVAQLFAEVTHDEYVAGLWKSRIVEGLNWSVPITSTTRSLYRAPTWSWASVDDAVQYHNSSGSYEMSIDFADVAIQERCSSGLFSENRLCLEVRAPIASFVDRANDAAQSSASDGRPFNGTLHLDYRAETQDKNPPTFDLMALKVSTLVHPVTGEREILEVAGIVLQKRLDLAYERVGYFTSACPADFKIFESSIFSRCPRHTRLSSTCTPIVIF